MAEPRPLDPAFSDLVACLELIDDPRAENSRHSLSAVLFCVLVGVMCGADDLVNAEVICWQKIDFIRRYVPLRNGIPSHDTMGRLLAAIDPGRLVEVIAQFNATLAGKPAREIINIDGKTLRGVPGKAKAKKTAQQAHMVSAFSTTRSLVLASLRSPNVANEVRAAQELLKILDVKGAIVTLDAAHTARETLSLIEERGADVVIAVKANSAKLLDAISDAFEDATPRVVETTDDDHGVVETRRYEVVPATGDVVEKSFPSLQSFICVTRENTSHSDTKKHQKRKLASSTNTFVGAYATSLAPKEFQRIATCIRSRWAIENKVHWVLDVTFNEDRSRVQTKNAPENLARIRHVALGLLGKIKGQRSYATARLIAGLNEDFLRRALRLPKAA